ncbi:nuclear transport factor 2 family protein [Bradyrhizobium neotropicale]|uniref:nuclear transport factor 2 family protein n=1 Tax=Bradyrhizobium neotropicale TaxID=1497615 RepID=UPI001AD713F3|nr:nuclear transport factor 2 family protein [Bradyrhizobium neotropicale]MBO4225750.1 nuclear transport factor 2 family protein [Bradyrhizobium neotropicale]
MSNKEVIEALRAAFTGYERNNNTALLEMLSDDFTFEMSDSLPYWGTYVGRAEFLGFWRAVAKEWTYFRYDAHEIIDVGDTIVVPVKTDALSTGGIRMRNEHLFLFKIRDGRPVHARLYADTARGRDVIAGEKPRHYPKPDLG